jgi:hypothetical protein
MEAFAEKFEVETSFAQYTESVRELTKKVSSNKAAVERFKNLGSDIHDKIDTIFARQQEVNLGKRNVNCLSCGLEPKNVELEGRDGQVYVGTHSKPKIRENVSPHTHKGARIS